MSEKFPGFFTALFSRREEKPQKPKPQKKPKSYDGEIKSLQSQIEEIRGMITSKPEPEPVVEAEPVEDVEDVE
tara:strand:- start:142 stop:360 length:219 start_codon:yes stop_codon:yes gene_type:complete